MLICAVSDVRANDAQVMEAEVHLLANTTGRSRGELMTPQNEAINLTGLVPARAYVVGVRYNGLTLRTIAPSYGEEASAPVFQSTGSLCASNMYTVNSHTSFRNDVVVNCLFGLD